MTRREFLKTALAFYAATNISPAMIEIIVANISDQVIAKGFAQSGFHALLAEYFPLQLLKEEMMKRHDIFSKIPKTDAWKGAIVSIPLKYDKDDE